MQPDWSLDMRWKMQEIVQNLLLGPYNVALNLDLLQAVGIQTIIIIKSDQESFIKEFHPEKFQYWTIIASNSNNTFFHFDESSKFIQRQLDQNRKVLVHCVGGISRAPTIVIAYLIYSNMSFEQAYQLVQTKRMCVNPLDVFMLQLTGYEQYLNACRQNLGIQCGTIAKRTIANEQSIGKRSRTESPD